MSTPAAGHCGAAARLREGVGPSCVGLPAGPWPTLMDFLAQRFPHIDRATWLDRLARGQVWTESGQALSVAQACQPPCPAPTRLFYYREVPNEPNIAARETVLYQDAHLLVADKPHGLPVAPSGRYLHETLLVRLRRRLDLPELAPLHRIDRDTAGLVLFSVKASERRAYSALFSQRQVRKTYHAIAAWRSDVPLPQTRISRIRPAGHFMLQHETPGEPNAITHIELLQVRGAHALYRLRPETGQRHQLRVHMLALGLPILNDGLYPTLTPEGACNPQRPLQLLARELDFTDPITGRAQHFVSQRELSG